MRDGLQGNPIWKSRLFGDSFVSKGPGLRELSMVDGFMADGLVEVENRKGSGMTTGILEAREHWGENTTNGVKQGTSGDSDS